MDGRQFDSMTQGAARVPDRRNMLKLVGAAAVASVAGAALSAEEGPAKKRNNRNNRKNKQRGLVNVVITEVISGNEITIPIKNNNVAVQICAAVDAIDVDLLGVLDLLDVVSLECDIEQRQ